MRVTGHELTFVHRIEYNRITGTAFMLHTPKGSCFVTVSHNVRSCVAGDNILFQMSDQWIPAHVDEIIFDPDGYDLCVFSSKTFMMEGMREIYPVGKGVALGDELLFAGFPHGLVSVYEGIGFPVPLVRIAHYSGMISVKGLDIIILDSFNNPGYSGAPVYHKDDEGTITLFAMISGYRPEKPSHGRIYRKTEDGQEEELPDIYTKPNSGMTQAIHINMIARLAMQLKLFNPTVYRYEGPDSDPTREINTPPDTPG